jgi:hypothetical protein
VESELNHPTFSQNLHSQFRVVPDSSAVALDLVEVGELASSPRQEQFSVVFRGPARPFLSQGMYRLAHERMGEFDLFLVPVGRDGDRYLYEAVFNRLTPTGR